MFDLKLHRFYLSFVVFDAEGDTDLILWPLDVSTNFALVQILIYFPVFLIIDSTRDYIK